MNTLHLTLRSLRCRARARGLDTKQWLARAGVSESTFYRAMRRRRPTMLTSTLTRLEQAAMGAGE